LNDFEFDDFDNFDFIFLLTNYILLSK